MQIHTAEQVAESKEQVGSTLEVLVAETNVQFPFKEHDGILHTFIRSTHLLVTKLHVCQAAQGVPPLLHVLGAEEKLATAELRMQRLLSFCDFSAERKPDQQPPQVLAIPLQAVRCNAVQFGALLQSTTFRSAVATEMMFCKPSTSALTALGVRYRATAVAIAVR